MKTIDVPKGVSIAVIGDVHEHPEQFQLMLDKIQPSEKMWLVSVGDIYHKGFGTKCAESITDELIGLSKKSICFAVKGNHELKEIKKTKHYPTKQIKWWSERPLCLPFQFHTGTRLTVVHAGITPKTGWDDLFTDVEVAYVRDVDEKGKMIQLKWKEIDGVQTLVKAKEGGSSWHEIYCGRFGYIAAGHAAQKDGLAKYYKYSCNLDSAVYETGILTAQVFNSDGSLGEKITVSGTAAKPELNLGY